MYLPFVNRASCQLSKVQTRYSFSSDFYDLKCQKFDSKNNFWSWTLTICVRRLSRTRRLRFVCCQKFLTTVSLKNFYFCAWKKEEDERFDFSPAQNFPSPGFKWYKTFCQLCLWISKWGCFSLQLFLTQSYIGN